MRLVREYRNLADVRIALGDRLGRGAVPGLFDRLDWFAALHRHCFSDVPTCIVRAQEDGREAWLFLIARGDRYLSALANWYSFSWTPLFLGDPDPATQARLLDGITRHLLQNHAHIDLYPLETMPDALIGALRRAGWFAVRRQMGGRHLLRLNGRDFAAYWGSRPGHLRNLVKRKGRASRFILSITDRLTDALWDDYGAVHALSWKQPEPALPFLRALAQQESAAGNLRLGFARLDGRAVATQLWTVENGVALIHKLAHDRTHDDGSPGTLLSHAMFAHVIDVDRVALIDYGTGDNPYKADWMETRAPLYRIDAFNPRCASAWLPAARTAISALVG